MDGASLVMDYGGLDYFFISLLTFANSITQRRCKAVPCMHAPTEHGFSRRTRIDRRLLHEKKGGRGERNGFFCGKGDVTDLVLFLKSEDDHSNFYIKVSSTIIRSQPM